MLNCRSTFVRFGKSRCLQPSFLHDHVFPAVALSLCADSPSATASTPPTAEQDLSQTSSPLASYEFLQLLILAARRFHCHA
ncbi:hypothetical protein DFP72DRAFT_1072919 [Ephemerocybe angulata]|uniref:Uncharacterized protein n=1 Tax=Ephemerocybe angulata TaxID=980116 RepID=A0A8H6HMC8_9AGAR|nr:hypothetical protein DFP72DRAFT_1072919 [Tulosesus angulatus]